MPERDDKSTKSIHFVLLVGYEYKGPLFEYNAGNSNRKINSTMYTKILYEYIEPELRVTKGGFILKEDGDDAYFTTTNTKVKEAIGLEYYRSCVKSPNLSVLENLVALALKQLFRKEARFSKEFAREKALECYKNIRKDSINKAVDSILERLQAVIDREGQYTKW